MSDVAASIGVLGGSGLYDLAALSDAREARIDTPFGAPSDALVVGRIGDRAVAFLARHGRGHRLLPSEINYRANVYAMKAIGVTRLLSASAVGSMRESVHPRDVVLPDQFIDHTRHRSSTFFGGGVAGHVGMADPVCPEARGVLADAARGAGARAHDGGTYLCIEGPAFSTRAESRLFRSWGVDVIGMTNATEAKLAREAGLCYATLALVTDYDCWHDGEDDVTVGGVLENLRRNAALAADVLRRAIEGMPAERTACACAASPAAALITSAEAIDRDARTRLGVLLPSALRD